MISKEMFKKPNNRLEGELEQPASRRVAGEKADTLDCPECKEAIAKQELFSLDYVCPRCGAALTMPARERVAWLTDEGSFKEMNAGLQPTDRLQFPEYAAKLRKTQMDCGEPEGVLTGTATVGGEPCALFIMNPAFIMGSMWITSGSGL